MAHRATQVVAEVALQGPTSVRASQVVAEVALAGVTATRVSQVVVEVLRDLNPQPLSILEISNTRPSGSLETTYVPGTTMVDGAATPTGGIVKDTRVSMVGVWDTANAGQLSSMSVLRHPSGNATPTGVVRKTAYVVLGGGISPVSENFRPVKAGLAGYVYNKIFVLARSHPTYSFDGSAKVTGRVLTTITHGVPHRTRHYLKNRRVLLEEIDEDLAEVLT